MLVYGSAYAEETKSKLINVQNVYFMYYSDSKYKEVFRTPEDSSLYGFGLLPDNKALFACQAPGYAEAIAILVVKDTNTGETVFKDSFGGTGETSFSFSKESGSGVFNDSEGLKIILIKDDNVIITPIKGIEEQTPLAPFWVDATIIGYLIYQDDK